MGSKIKLAKEWGFCWGVEAAINKVDRILIQRKKAYCLGSLIHNPQINNILKGKGLKIIKNLDGVSKGILVIPSHGLSKITIEKAKKSGLKLVNATCPFLENIQKIVLMLSKKNYQVVIIGEKRHKEVQTLKSLADNIVVIEEPLEIKNKKFSTKIGVIVQTTQTKEKFNEAVKELLKKDFQEIRIFNTLCKVVQKRQKEAAKLAVKVDLMLVIGGKNSANTCRLADICAQKRETYHIEDSEQIRRSWLKDKNKIGIITGTSTPRFLVEEIIKKTNELI